MNLFTTPVTLTVNYGEDFEVTLARFLAILHEKPSVPRYTLFVAPSLSKD